MGKRIIVDFDNTMGVAGCDVDDGLALLYLLGCPEAQVEAVCSTYGNNTLDTVHENTRRTLKEYQLDVPLLRGMDAALAKAAKAGRPYKGQVAASSKAAGGGRERRAPAGAGLAEARGMGAAGAGSGIVADGLYREDAPDEAALARAAAAAEAPGFLADALAAAPGEVHVLATGSTTNLGAACLVRPGALADAASITMMGGITRALGINGRIMNELNLSCDAAATRMVLASGAPVAIATAQNCLPAFFSRDDLTGAFGRDSWLYRTCDYWFRSMGAAYEWDGWVCWDVVAAAYLMHPELFDDCPADVTLDERLLSVGYLETGNPDAPTARVNLPQIRDAAAFKAHVLETWHRGLQRTGLDLQKGTCKGDGVDRRSLQVDQAHADQHAYHY